jgi:hypothetical protein
VYALFSQQSAHLLESLRDFRHSRQLCL